MDPVILRAALDLYNERRRRDPATATTLAFYASERNALRDSNPARGQRDALTFRVAAAIAAGELSRDVRALAAAQVTQ